MDRSPHGVQHIYIDESEIKHIWPAVPSLVSRQQPWPATYFARVGPSMAPLQQVSTGGGPAGAVVDRKKLGEGTYGEVFAVVAPDGQVHACKRFKIGERAKQEGLPLAVYRDIGIAQMLASLKHENIAVARQVVLERSDVVRISMYSECAESDLSQRLHQMKKNQTRFTTCEVRLPASCAVARIAVGHQLCVFYLRAACYYGESNCLRDPGMKLIEEVLLVAASQVKGIVRQCLLGAAFLCVDRFRDYFD
eukprot:4765190-Pleurochrysis_carterae.AAC.1